MSAAVQTFGDPPRAIPSKEVTRLMLEMLQLKPTDKLMEIGTGSASQTGIWSEHCKEVHTVELKAFNRCDSLGNHVFFREGDGKDGIPAEAPFDAIVVTCGTEQVFPAWREQLAEGGRLVAPIGKADIQRLTLFSKMAGIVLPVKVGGYVRFQMMEKT
jgi:protein-L-isoaspartate(D-aspartate) O-methyltransferase